MASSDKKPVPPTPASGAAPLADMSAKETQSLLPAKQLQQHVCTFALYAHDPKRQIETHHYVARLNQDVLQCAVYDSDAQNARLIGTPLAPIFIFSLMATRVYVFWHARRVTIVDDDG
jgi:hypothetical protein